LLYKCGGFAPSTEDEEELVRRFNIRDDHIIRRHGTRRREQLKRLLSHDLYSAVEDLFNSSRGHSVSQTSDIQWSGGYFGLPGRLEDAKSVDDSEKHTWRKEYLPGPTALLATAICGAVSGTIADIHPTSKHFRVTLHRVLTINREELLQQSCEYMGRNVPIDGRSGRTFPAANATIGLAYQTRRIIRSTQQTTPGSLRKAMAALNLNEASSNMSVEVGFVLAIPILQPISGFFEPSPVCGVVYVDSKDDGFWLSDDDVGRLKIVVEHAVENIRSGSSLPLDRLRNTPLRNVTSTLPSSINVPETVEGALEALNKVSPPSLQDKFIFNFDHSDLTPL
jgi:hypothetical protein